MAMIPRRSEPPRSTMLHGDVHGCAIRCDRPRRFVGAEGRADVTRSGRATRSSRSPSPGASPTISRGVSGPRSWSQNRIGYVSCRIALTLVSLRAWRRCWSSSAVTDPGSVPELTTIVPLSLATTTPPTPPGRVARTPASPPLGGESPQRRHGFVVRAVGIRSF